MHGMVAAAARMLTQPVTSYANPGGSGNRTASITVTRSFTPDGSPAVGLIINGVNTGAAGWDMPGTGSTAIADGDFVKFDFGVGVKKYIDEWKLYFNATPSMGAWVLQGSDDDASYATYGSFTWDTATQIVTLAGIPPEGHRYWKMAKNGAGSNFTNNWFQEVEFKIAAGAT